VINQLFAKTVTNFAVNMTKDTTQETVAVSMLDALD
jgi:hypothetical protein